MIAPNRMAYNHKTPNSLCLSLSEIIQVIREADLWSKDSVFSYLRARRVWLKLVPNWSAM